MYTLVEILGKQYKAEKGARLKVDRLDGNAGDAVEFDSVLLVSDQDQVKVGTPYLEGIKVRAVVEEQIRDRKVVIFKYRKRKNYRKRMGHRQPYTIIRVQDIEGL